jgi:hypothetical protein
MQPQFDGLEWAHCYAKSPMAFDGETRKLLQIHASIIFIFFHIQRLALLTALLLSFNCIDFTLVVLLSFYSAPIEELDDSLFGIPLDCCKLSASGLPVVFDALLRTLMRMEGLSAQIIIF